MAYYLPNKADLSELRNLTELELSSTAVPRAMEISKGIPIYHAPDLENGLTSDERDAILSEWAWIFGEGPGVLVIRDLIPDGAAIDAATVIYEAIMAEEEGLAAADHFASAGNNVRVWNSAQKLCLAAPDVFLQYFGSVSLDAVCEAWLGPAYQLTAQVNLVRPGGAAQEAHRDYHLGFQSAENAARFPAHVHDLSPLMTLQGAVAHCDMPVESGPTKLLPHSQKWGPGYIEMRRQDVRDLFEEKFVQLPLSKGDGLFFNPAVFHAAGSNTSSDIQRFANLMQIGSAFGRTLETLDRHAMALALYSALQASNLPMAKKNAAIACAAEGYPFPTNLDTDPPIGGNAPESQADLIRNALLEGTSEDVFALKLQEHSDRRSAAANSYTKP